MKQKKKNVIRLVSAMILILILFLFNRTHLNPVWKLSGSLMMVMLWFTGMMTVVEMQKKDWKEYSQKKKNLIETGIFLVLLLFTCFILQRHLRSVVLKGVFRFLLSGIAISGFLVSVAFLQKRISLVKGFVILSAVLGTAFQFVMPAGEVPDEWVHFQTAYVLANEMTGINEGKNPKDIYMRKDDASFEIMQTEVSEEDYERYLSSAYDSLHDAHMVKIDSKALNSDEYLYVVPACGILLGRILHMNSFWTIELGRFCNLLFGILIISLGIRLIPVGKEIMTVTALMPMTLQQNMSYSYDVPVNAFSFLIIAISVRLLVDEEYRMKAWTWILTGIGMFLLIMAKRHAYFLIGLLPVFVWLERKIKGDQKKKDQIMKRIVILIVIGIALILVFFFSGMALKVIPESHHMVYWNAHKEGYTFWYFAKNPGQLILLPVNTIRYQAGTYFTSYFGKWMGWFEINVGNIPSLVMFVLLINAVITEENRIEKKDGRMLLIMVSVLEILCVFAAFVLGFSSLSKPYIEGVQGRYLIAPVTLILISIAGKKTEKKISGQMNLYLIVFTALWTLSQILIWYGR